MGDNNKIETKPKATLALKNATIYTMDEGNTQAEAIALVKDRILYVGNDTDLQTYIDAETKIIDLEGKTVVPGFVDAHVHQPIKEIFQLYTLNLADVPPTVKDYQNALHDYAIKNPNLEMIFGTGFALTAFGEEGPNKRALDEIVDDKPVVLADISFHTRLANSKALEKNGITKDTQTPNGGQIYKDKNGELTGYFADCSYLFPEFYNLVDSLTKDQYLDALKLFQDDCAQKGITAIQGATGGNWEWMDCFAQEGKLNLRLNLCQVMDPFGEVDEIIQKLDAGQMYNSDFQKINTVKIFYDGVIEGGTAALIDPYDAKSGMPKGYRGESQWETDKLREAITAIDHAGYRVHVHSIGDRATKETLDMIEHAMQQNGGRDARHTITHLVLVSGDDIIRMGRLGVIAAMQPIWFYKDSIWEIEEKMLGAKRANRMYAVKDMLDAGVIITGSADSPISPDNRPLAGIQTGVTRRSPYDGKQNNPQYARNQDQCLSAMDMLRAYTINGAKQLCMESLIGSLEQGKKADFVVLSQDILNIPVDEISKTKVEKVIFNGEVIYSRDEESSNAIRHKSE